jgi:hypothetical protein
VTQLMVDEEEEKLRVEEEEETRGGVHLLGLIH